MSLIHHVLHLHLLTLLRTVVFHALFTIFTVSFLNDFQAFLCVVVDCSFRDIDDDFFAVVEMTSFRLEYKDTQNSVKMLEKE